PKLELAGANKVVFPLRLTGNRMAMHALRPLVVDFIESVFHGRQSTEQEIEELLITPESELVGKTVAEGEKLTSVLVLAIKKVGGQLISRPRPKTLVQPGDELIVVGKRSQLEGIESTE
ncbi:MAG: TrkA C-terminal domain-containing protein, partial [Chloroflexota bacterium]|nr:TrkA C-terminal domain-containing protein [Chloroflexota bacterium]